MVPEIDNNKQQYVLVGNLQVLVQPQAVLPRGVTPHPNLRPALGQSDRLSLVRACEHLDTFAKEIEGWGYNGGRISMRGLFPLA